MIKIGICGVHGSGKSTKAKELSDYHAGIGNTVLVVDKVARSCPYPLETIEAQFHCNMWQKYASPVWFDIRQSNTLQRTSARDEKDERHICPLQLDAIQRCIELWTNPNDLVYDPFAGIGSVPYQAILMGRRGVGCELKQSYFDQAIKNLAVADQKVSAPKQVGFDYFGEE